MSRPAVTARTAVAGVVGSPVTQSLSPILHNAWLTAAGHDAVYAAFPVEPQRFEAFIEGLRGGAVRGVNVTAPFKSRALALADDLDASANTAHAANLLLFGQDSRIEAHNTDGVGLLAAFAEQAPGWLPSAGPVVVIGADGASRGAIAALTGAGAHVRVANRTRERAEHLSQDFPEVSLHSLGDLSAVLEDAAAVINAAPLDEASNAGVSAAFSRLAPEAVVMDMVYTPLETPLLSAARKHGLQTVDGLAMLIGQARPSFERLFGISTPDTVDVRALAEQALAGQR